MITWTGMSGIVLPPVPSRPVKLAPPLVDFQTWVPPKDEYVAYAMFAFVGLKATEDTQPLRGVVLDHTVPLLALSAAVFR
jgi:hypothetical protein